MGTIGKCCNGGCCCCGTGQMPDLPDYYCRFYEEGGILWPWVPPECVDSPRQKLHWDLSQFNLDGSAIGFDLQADYAGRVGEPNFENDEDMSCWIEYKNLLPYVYTFEYTQDTEWVIIEESQCSGTRFVPGIGVRDYCSRFQTQARVKYGLQNLKVNIARCKIPNQACDDEVEDMIEKECGYLVTATMDVVYVITTMQTMNISALAPAGSGTACDSLPDFLPPMDPSYDPIASGIAGNPTVTYYTKCITRSKIFKSLKNNPADATQIYIKLERPIASQDVECCKSWPSPNRKAYGGKDENYNDETFRCSCESELVLSVKGDCEDNTCLEIDPNATQTCMEDGILIPYMAGNDWILSW
jgi:hypothetical protein